MAAEKGGFFKALRSTPEMKRRTRNEFLGFGVAGTILSAGLATGLILAGDKLSADFTDLISSGLHYVPFVPSNFEIPHYVDSGVNALGHLVNSIPGASAVPHFASEHFSGVSTNQDFWGAIEGVTGVVAAGKFGIVAYEAGKRKLEHAQKAAGGTVFGSLYEVGTAVHGLGKIVDFGSKAAETISTFGDPTPLGINDLLALSYILLGYRPGKGILNPLQLLAMSALLLTPLPTVTTYDFITGAMKHAKNAGKHVDTLSKHAQRLRDQGK